MSPERAFILGVALAFDAFAFDQITKFIVRNISLNAVGDFSFIHLRLAGSSNPHFAFSLPAPELVIIAAVSAVLVAVALRWLREAGEGKASSLALAVIIGAAMSNLFDRLAFKGVFDWIEVGIRHWSVSSMNIADILIVAGVIAWAWVSRQQSTAI